MTITVVGIPREKGRIVPHSKSGAWQFGWIDPGALLDAAPGSDTPDE
jgi:hypothetical protein